MQAPDRRLGKDAAEDADEDDPAKVNAQHGSHQHGARRGRDEGVADSQTGQQGDAVYSMYAPFMGLTAC